MTTQITQESFGAFLKCPTKSRLYTNGAQGIESEFGEWQRRTQERYNAAAAEQLRSSLQASEWCIGAPPAEQFNRRCYRLVFDYPVADTEIQARLHGLELHRSEDRVERYSYVPIRFVGNEKLAASDRLMLAFDAFAFSRATGKLPAAGKLVHGSRYSTVSVPLAKLLVGVRSILEKIASESTKSPSPVVLNRHCTECEFRTQCRQIAREKDDLSLLPTISDNQRKKFHEKGIFTVTQLSYTFRPRKRSKPGITKHFPALKALAIRQQKIHILGAPTVGGCGTPVYFDVEGDADRDFYYLIGMRSEIEGSKTQYSFWADDPAAEERIWTDFLERLKEIDSPHLIHYGSYETKFLKRMRTRYPNARDPAFIDRLARSALNLLSVIYKHVYFPTYSNALKEVAKYLGCRWSEDGASGLNALVWRSKWEISHDSQLKQKLLTYNAEDCEATRKVAEALAAACESALAEKPTTSVINADSLKREYPQRFGSTEFALPEFQKINQAAYWDYQRNRVYVRSDTRLQRRKAPKQDLRTSLRANKSIFVDEVRPASCWRCNGTLIYKWGRYSQTVFDLRFSPGNIKRWVVRYSFSRYICWRCKTTFIRYVRKPKYGAGLCAYLLYQVIDVQTPQNIVAKTTRQLFGLPLSTPAKNGAILAGIGRGRIHPEPRW